MKNTICALLMVALITFFMYIYVESNFYGGMAEFCLSEAVQPEKIKEALEQGQVYDYLIIYDLYNKENSKVYTGNINMLLAGRIKEKTDIELSEREVLMGDRFAAKNYAYNPIGKKHEFNNKEYSITAIINDSDDIYYNDVNISENQNIKRQRVYAVLKDKDGVVIEENTLLSILKSKNIAPDSHIYYDNLSKLLIKLIILCFISLFIYVIYKLISKLKKLLSSIFSGYEDSKYNIDIREYVNKRENYSVIRGMVLYSAALIISITCSIVLLIKYLNLRMPYRFNPVSPKSIYDMIKSFFDLILYYLYNGITEMSLIVFKVAFMLFIALILSLAIIIIKKLPRPSSSAVSVKKT